MTSTPTTTRYHMETTKSTIIDLREVCETLEATFGGLLLPDAPGWYLPYSLTPAIKAGRSDYVMYHQNQALPFTTPANIVSDVVDGQDRVVVPLKLARKLTQTPRYTPRTIRLVRDCVEHLLRQHAAYLTTANAEVMRNRDDPETRAIKLATAESVFLQQTSFLNRALSRGRIPFKVYDEYFADASLELGLARRSFGKVATDPDFAPNGNNLTAVIREFVNPKFANDVDILTTIETCILNVTNHVMEFLGADTWIMHFLKIRHATLELEKTIDYRILSWHQMTGTPM